MRGKHAARLTFGTGASAHRVSKCDERHQGNGMWGMPVAASLDCVATECHDGSGAVVAVRDTDDFIEALGEMVGSRNR